VSTELPAAPFEPAARDRLAAALLGYVRQRRWFRAKARPVEGARVADLLPLPGTMVVILEVLYRSGEPDLYLVPLAAAQGSPLGEGLPFADGLATGQSAEALLGLVGEGRTVAGEGGALHGERAPIFAEIAGGAPLPPRISGTEQTNSTVMFGDRLLLKVYRQLSAGANVELEMGRYLTERCQPPCVPRVLGALRYQPKGRESRSVGIVHELLANDGDAWTLALAEVNELLDRASGAPPPGASAGRFVTLAMTLGRRTGELHRALGQPTDDPAFAPEPLAAADRQALVARARAMLGENLAALEAARPRLPAEVRPLADELLARRQSVAALLGQLCERDFPALKTRTHGDLHLGQVLVRGDDFVIIDFEGEPARPLAERRAKSSPLRDVMGMARSFDYAPAAALRERPRPDREAWAALWTRQVTDAYLRGYRETVQDGSFLPPAEDDQRVLRTFYQLEKVIYEVGYEANNRPDWVEIPLRGLLSLTLSGAR
jgi:trehalose synthase-fused probable maltokinase